MAVELKLINSELDFIFYKSNKWDLIMSINCSKEDIDLPSWKSKHFLHWKSIMINNQYFNIVYYTYLYVVLALKIYWELIDIHFFHNQVLQDEFVKM